MSQFVVSRDIISDSEVRCAFDHLCSWQLKGEEVVANEWRAALPDGM